MGQESDLEETALQLALVQYEPLQELWACSHAALEQLQYVYQIIPLLQSFMLFLRMPYWYSFKFCSMAESRLALLSLTFIFVHGGCVDICSGRVFQAYTSDGVDVCSCDISSFLLI